jgi:hypothetical protein
MAFDERRERYFCEPSASDKPRKTKMARLSAFTS